MPVSELLEISTATEADVPMLVEMGQAMIAEGPWIGELAPADPEFLEYMLGELIAKDDSHEDAGAVFLLKYGAEPERQIIGAFVAVIGPFHFWSPTPVPHELAFYVAPAARAQGYGSYLIEAFRDWYRSLGHNRGFIGNGSGVAPETVADWYERLGARIVGQTYVLEDT